jgi:threonine synthase
MDAACGAEFPIERILTACPTCARAGRGESLLDVVYDLDAVRQTIDARRLFGPGGPAGGSGVWQFRELLPFARSEQDIVTVGEGRTILQRATTLSRHIGLSDGLYLQYEGLNPSGSFKDNGMAAGFTHARMVGAQVVACASTGNTSASLAMYAQQAGMRAFVFIGEGKIAFGKLSQALDYGATTLQIAGDFDACLARIREIAADPKRGVYLLNSVNPFRLEGQKTIMYRVLRDLGGPIRGGRISVPDWIVVPGGNLGNCSAFAKAFIELQREGRADARPGGEPVGYPLAAGRGGASRCGLAPAGDVRPWRGGRGVQADGQGEGEGAHDRERDRDQPAGEPAEGAAGTARDERRGAVGVGRRHPGAQGAGRAVRVWV